MAVCMMCWDQAEDVTNFYLGNGILCSNNNDTMVISSVLPTLGTCPKRRIVIYLDFIPINKENYIITIITIDVSV